MRRVVMDAGAILSWFEPDGPRRGLRAEYEAGGLAVIGPRHLVADALTVLASERRLPADRLTDVAAELGRLGFELGDPPITELARWLAKGLPAHRAAYPALAVAHELPLVTDDPELRRVARTVLAAD